MSLKDAGELLSSYSWRREIMAMMQWVWLIDCVEIEFKMVAA